LRREIGLSYDDFVLISVSRISKEKNIDFLVEAHRHLLRKNKNIKLVIIGDGPTFEELKRKASRINNGKSIIFVGKVPWEKIPLYYQTGDVFVTASKTETQGLTVNEALSSSLPVVCIDDDSFKISVMHGFNGFFFKNRKEYINYVCELAGDKKLYATLSKQAKDSSLKFSIKYFGESILNIYKKAISKRKKNIIEKFKEFVYKE
jgi:1,2-diacylglycerol 3-alpha-glucosyltransferase